MYERLPPETRAQVEAAILRDPVPTFREIADECGVGTTTVQRIARELGVRDRWNTRTQMTAEATAANKAATAARRAELEARLLDTSHDLLDRLHDEVTQAMGTVTGVERIQLPAGPRDWRDTVTAIGTASKSANDIARLTAETANAGQARGLLAAFWESLEADEESDEEDEDETSAEDEPDHIGDE